MSRDNLKRDKNTYLRFWESIITKKIDSLSKEDGVSARNKKKSKRDIWKAYVAFNKHASINYMDDKDKPLDRHKVAACYMYAVLAASPLLIDSGISNQAPGYMANERLAVTLGCSILASFDSAIVQELKKSRAISVELAEKLDERIRRGVPFQSFPVGHGDYVENMLDCLRFTSIEGNYNLLLLSKLMYHWEERMIGNDLYEHIAKFRNVETDSISH